MGRIYGHRFVSLQSARPHLICGATGAGRRGHIVGVVCRRLFAAAYRRSIVLQQESLLEKRTARLLPDGCGHRRHYSLGNYRQSELGLTFLAAGRYAGEHTNSYQSISLSSFLYVAANPLCGHAQTFDWARQTGGDGVHGIAVDAHGYSYGAGNLGGSISLGPWPLTSTGSTDIFVAKFDDLGNCVWAHKAGCSWM